jgi:hypothetical protein
VGYLQFFLINNLHYDDGEMDDDDDDNDDHRNYRNI